MGGAQSLHAESFLKLFAAMEEAGVFPLSPVHTRDFAYSHTKKRNNMDSSDCSFRTREILMFHSNISPRLTSTISSADISKASPGRRIPEDDQIRFRDVNGKTGSLTSMDIAGAQSRSRHVKGRNKPDRIYSCRDIHKAHPCLKPHISDRFVDPLMPVYNYPSSRPGPPVVHFSGTMPLDNPRTLPGCADIPGAQSSLRFGNTAQRVSSFLKNDVDTKVKKFDVRNRKSPLDVSDIMMDPSGAGHVFRATRTTCPLDPRYDWNRPPGWAEDEHGKWEVGCYHGDKPRPLMNAWDCPRRLQAQLMPRAEHVEGAQPRALHAMQLARAAEAFKERSRREVRHTNH